MLGDFPPAAESIIRLRGSARQPQPGEDFVPDLPGKWALDEEVRHGFHCLVAEEASRVVLQTSALQAGCCPAAIFVGQPVEDLNAWWRPALPDEFSGAAGGGAVEGSAVT